MVLFDQILSPRLVARLAIPVVCPNTYTSFILTEQQGGRGKYNMPNRVYVCATCGVIQRASKVFTYQRQASRAVGMASPRWPEHCGQPMKGLTFVQAEGATQLTQEERVKWVAKGMHVLRQRQHGRHKWKPVIADWQIEEAQHQKLTYRLRLIDRAVLSQRRMPLKYRKDRLLATVEES